MSRVDDKTVIVTGASSGIGAHIVRHLASEGARVTATARRRHRLQALAEELSDAPGQVQVVDADIRNHDDVRRVVASTVEAFGGVDALVNNAGMEIQGPIETLDPDDFRSMLATNVMSPYLCIRAALPYLQVRGGSIINLGSTVVARPPTSRFAYIATKGAIEAMSTALAGDLGTSDIRVNVVRPGIVASELRGMTEEEEAEALTERSPRLQALAAVGRGSDVASMVTFLISDAARWITGAVIDVDGGYKLGLRRDEP